MPFDCSQNIMGYYPIMAETFICEADGDLLECTNETRNLRWISTEELDNLLKEDVQDFYPMHVAALKRYINFNNRD
jgi:isopentenyldiphosphate isomerase